jgi:hypothetical protein
MSDAPLKFEDNVLLCPNCNQINLHHDKTTVFDRDEDAEVTSVTEVYGGNPILRSLSSSVAGNPSLRRDGVAIRFWCEHCSAVSEMTIAQHKGESLVAWRTVGHRVSPDS